MQTLMYGAQVFAVQGSYDDAFDLCLESLNQTGTAWSRSCDNQTSTLVVDQDGRGGKSWRQ
jgi:threonine synthase